MRKRMLIFTIIIIGYIALMLTSCKSAPDREDFAYDACYDAQYCIYLCGDSDKVICAEYIKECSNFRVIKECEKLEMPFQECFDKVK